jgi:hypothetical protein
MLAQIAALRAEVEDPTCALRAELADELDRGTVEYRRSTCGQELGLSVPRTSMLEPRLGSASDPAQLAVRVSRRLHGSRSTEHTHQGLDLTQPKRLA